MASTTAGEKVFCATKVTKRGQISVKALGYGKRVSNGQAPLSARLRGVFA